jgi:membrane protease YdiL (CAAX protease family)
MEVKEKTLKEILTFLFLTLGLSSFFYYKFIRAGTLEVENGLLYVLGLMWCPGFSGLITTLVFQRNLRGLGWHWGKTRYQVLSFFLPFFYALPVYALVWVFALGELKPSFSTRPQSYVVAIFFGCLTALGEEIGWRGFLVPRLYRLTGFTRVSLISGAIWALWHFPLILFSDYNSGTPLWYGALCFSVLVIGMSFAYAWFRLRTESVWTAMFLHAMHNYFIQGQFDRITADTRITAYLTGEFGAGLVFAALAVTWIFWRQRDKLPSVRSFSSVKPKGSSTHN